MSDEPRHTLFRLRRPAGLDGLESAASVSYATDHPQRDVTDVVLLFAWTRTLVGETVADGELLDDRPGGGNELSLRASIGADLRVAWRGEEPRMRQVYWRFGALWVPELPGAGAVAIDDDGLAAVILSNTPRVIIEARRDLIRDRSRVPEDLAAAHEFFLELDVNTHADFRNAGVVGIDLDPNIGADNAGVQRDLRLAVAARCLASRMELPAHRHDNRVGRVLTYMERILRKRFSRGEVQPGSGDPADGLFDAEAAGRAFLRFANGDLALRELDVNLDAHGEPNSTLFLLFTELAFAAPAAAEADVEVWGSMAGPLVAAAEVFASSYRTVKFPENDPDPIPTRVGAVQFGGNVTRQRGLEEGELEARLAQQPLELEARFATAARLALFGVENFVNPEDLLDEPVA